MKKRNNLSLKAHLLQGAIYLLLMSAGTLFAFLRPQAPANLPQRTLTFAQRVAYQRAIEEVYWRHRIWGKERPDPKPSIDSVMPQAQLEKKVADYLGRSQALKDHYHRPIAAEQLQAEMERIAQHTKQPEVLRELFAALGNDPFVIAECLARPVLTERLTADVSGKTEQNPSNLHGTYRRQQRQEICRILFHELGRGVPPSPRGPWSLAARQEAHYSIRPKF
jgi:hypothetical protein